METSSVLVLEGGAMRSVFSAGIIDCLMEKGIQIPNVLAISAGAYAGMNYLSGQKGRMVEAVIKPLGDYKYMGFGTYLKKGTFFDMDYFFQEIPKKRSPFHFKAFQESDSRFITSTLNCATGELMYHEKFQDEEQFFAICQAANSMPYIARVTQIDGIPVMDGGIKEAIPITKIMEEGFKKMVIVLTREESYRKKPYNWFYINVAKIIYRKYPEFVKLLKVRHNVYNDALKQVAQWEKEGKALVFRPTQITVKNSESNVDRLMEYYHYGYRVAKERIEELKRFLEI